MRLLLDTHIWIRAVMRPESLDREIQRLLSHPSHELFLSPISVWEGSHLARARRLRINIPYSEWFRRTMAEFPLLEAPLSFAVAAEVSHIHLDQPDFGDLFLAATASVYDLTLVTEDPQLLSCKWLKTLR